MAFKMYELSVLEVAQVFPGETDGLRTREMYAVAVEQLGDGVAKFIHVWSFLSTADMGKVRHRASHV